MEAVVHQPLCHVERRDPVVALQVPRGEHELVHAQPVVRELVDVLQAREQVVRVQHRDLAHLAQMVPPRADECVRPHEDAERPGERPHLADRLRAVEVEPEAVSVLDRLRNRQERLQDVPDRDRPAARPAAAVRLRERLVQVDVHDVEAHVAGPGDPADGVQVRAVVVHERAHPVEDRGDLLDVLVEEPERRGVRQHQPGRVLVDHLAQVLDVDVAARVGGDLLQLEAGHRHRRWVRPVRGVRDDDLPPVRLASVGEVGAHQEQAGQLAL